jgi:hypothetical protein
MRHVVLAAMAVVMACILWSGCWAEEARREVEPPQVDVAKSEAPAREPAPPTLAPHKKMGMWAGNPGKFFEGAFSALSGHETGHLIANLAQGSSPYTKPVHYGPIPFFTIEPGRHLNPHEHYITASAGFNAQHIINECILQAHPNLRGEDRPYLKGVVTFNFWLTMGYAATAFAGTGPSERDTKGMADALGCSEKWIGVMILAPTVLDKYRYDHPEAKWAKTASWATKLLMIGLAAAAHD